MVEILLYNNILSAYRIFKSIMNGDYYVRFYTFLYCIAGREIMGTRNSS